MLVIDLLLGNSVVYVFRMVLFGDCLLWAGCLLLVVLALDWLFLICLLLGWFVFVVELLFGFVDLLWVLRINVLLMDFMLGLS